MSILTVENLNKSYPTFCLRDVSFSLAPGKITGLIGRNGAGKTTTLKSLLNLVHPDSGQILFWNKSFAEHEQEIKQRIGYVNGGFRFYPQKKLKTITGVTRDFYKEWDDKAYNEYMRMFALDEQKKPSSLSEGMKVKYALTLALSHNADLLILDEPTSGLDPVSREELLDIFLELCRLKKTILFSTHITSDLEKCADHILYMKQGRMVAQESLQHFTARYRLVELNAAQAEANKGNLLGCKTSKNGFTALIEARQADAFPAAKPADLDAIMVHLEKEETL